MMRAHLREAAVVLTVLADEDCLDGGFHVVVHAARAGALEEGKAALVRVQHHLLRLARIRSNEHHPAVAQPQMRDFHRHRRAVQHDDLVTTSRTGRPRRVRTTVARRRRSSGSSARAASSANSAAPRRSHPRSPGRAEPRIAGSASDVLAATWPCFQPASDQDRNRCERTAWCQACRWFSFRRCGIQ